MPKIVIDGKEIEAKENETVLSAALRSGIYIPHFCYHPHLQVAGNCRMCLVEIEKVPKLQISCGTPVREGMTVFTKTDRVKKARAAVMEFLLIHHPLDCPVCDQCGECRLQDYCFEYGSDRSRFIEKKNTYPELSLGKTLSHNQNRCINCTRCIRFMRDLALDECLGLSERGGRTIVGTYTDKPVDNPFSVNIADICPVGSLTEKHFRFKARPWLMTKTATVCSGCSRGCNVTAWVYKGEILRLTPRVNNNVNLEWLCDEGRISFDKLYTSSRLTTPLKYQEETERDEVLACIVEKIKATKRNKIGIVSSLQLTNEDNFAVKALAEKIGTEKIYLIEPELDDRPFGPSSEPLPQWFIRKDKTPNTRGAVDMLGACGYMEDLAADIKNGAVKGLLVFGADPAGSLGQVASVMDKLEWSAVEASHQTKTVESSNLVLPGACAFEKDGTFTNEIGRVQKTAAVVPPPKSAVSTWQTASTLIELLDGTQRFKSAAEVFEAICKKVSSYSGLSYSSIGLGGVSLAKADTSRLLEEE